MIKLYGFDTINTLKVVMFLKETDQEFEFVPVNIRAGEQHQPEFQSINPAAKVPVLSIAEQHLPESNAILFSLAQKIGWGLIGDPVKDDELLAWLFYQASTQGPHFGQIEYWSKFAQSPNPEALARHRAIAERIIAHLNDQLMGKSYFCGENYSIADIALFPWLHIHGHLGLSLQGAQNLAAWLKRVRNRQTTKDACAFFTESSIF